MSKRLVYLDNAATTPVREEVLEAMLPYLGKDAFGNPSSAHRFGRAARAGIEEAKRSIAEALGGGAEPSQVIFTSGGTEADNLAVIGCALAARRRGDRAPRERLGDGGGGRARGGADARCGGGLRDVGEQRGGGHSAGGAARRAMSRGGRPVPHGCRPGVRQDSRVAPRRRLHLPHDLGPQDRRSQGHRGPRSAGPACRGSDHPRRRPTVRDPARHRERPGDRGPGEGGRAGRGGAGGVRPPRGRAARRARAPAARDRAGCRDQRLAGPAGAARHQRRHPGHGFGGAAHALRPGGHRLLLRLGVQHGRGRAFARAHRHGRAARVGRGGAAVLVRQGQRDRRRRGRDRCGAEDRGQSAGAVRGTASMSERVLVAMSGGVDSSVAAALLVEQGYDVVGATMKLFCYGDSVPDRPCCSLDSITDAQLVAHKLGIPHYVLNFEDRFGRDVIANFVAEYASGRTPIPCVRCNSFTKFRDFLYHADALDCAYVGTGHYAIARDGALFRGRDPRKDQSYFLWGIDRSVVARMLTPVGDLTKRETRAIARRLGLVTAEKVESVEICFVPDDDYVGVLERHLPADAPALTPGPLVTAGGDVVGEHAGFARYTIGQRRGLPGGFREPMYVVAIRPETREVVIGSGDDLFGHSVTLAELNWLADALAPGDAVLVQCRYRAPAVPGRVREQVGGAITLDLAQPVRAITPGQSGALYDADGRLLGGGVIA